MGTELDEIAFRELHVLDVHKGTLLYQQVLHHPERHVAAALFRCELQHTCVGLTVARAI